jgi:hypothetical protein
MADNNGNGKIGKFLLVEELSGRVVVESEYEICGLEKAQIFNEQGEIPNWDYVQKLSHKAQSHILIVEVKGKLSDLMIGAHDK